MKEFTTLARRGEGKGKEEGEEIFCAKVYDKGQGL